MNGDLYPHFPTLTQKQIGEHFGVTSHVVGRWLKDAGLREPSGQPSHEAIDAGYVELVDLGNGTRPFPVWRKKTITYLEQQGHLRPLVDADDAPPQTHLTGPFSVQCNGGDGYGIVDVDGITGVWVRGEENAKCVVNLMNLGHQYRDLWK